MATAREIAVLTLTACQRQGAWSDGHLKRMLREYRLDRREAALATKLCFGVLQTQMLLDWHLSRFSNRQLDQLEPKIHNILRVAVYQLLFLDKIPASATVNEAVKLARAHSRNPRTAGMVNGVLRALLRQMPLPEPEGQDALDTLAIRTSHPRWLVEAFSSRLGTEGAKALLEADNHGAPMAVQVNTCRIPAEALCARLEGEGVAARPHPWMPDCLILENSGNLEELDAFRQGLFYVQDCAARLAVTAAALAPGERVLDCCAAPGGKSFAAALDLTDRGEVVCCDIHPHKIGLMEAGKTRLGLNCLCPTLHSAVEPRAEWLNAFDAVIADVPCSGLGIIRKKPDIRYKAPAPLAGLPTVQSRILAQNAQYVRPGGRLIYSTCTLLERENEAVVEAFVRDHPDFSLEEFTLPHWGRQEGIMTFWPHIHDTDGFFIAKLRRKG